MKKIITLCTALILSISILTAKDANALGTSASSSIDLKYPVVLVHGWAGSDEFIFGIDYFYGIKSTLEDQGVDTYVADIGAFDTSMARGEKLKAFILEVLAISGKSKINIIAHSQGGITSRYVISNMGMSKKIASLTMISTPNRGTALCDIATGKLPKLAQYAIEVLADTFWGGIIAGDEDSNFNEATLEMTHYNMEQVFNPNTPDSNEVSYFSYAGKLFGASPNLLLTPTTLILQYYDGDNDGVVPVQSSKWGIWKGTITGLFGVDHFMEINHLFGNSPGFDTEGFYVDICEMLEGYGF